MKVPAPIQWVVAFIAVLVLLPWLDDDREEDAQ